MIFLGICIFLYIFVFFNGDFIFFLNADFSIFLMIFSGDFWAIFSLGSGPFGVFLVFSRANPRLLSMIKGLVSWEL